MNKVILIGRLSKDPEKRTTESGVSTCSFSVAVQRKFKNADGNYDADFINCVAWRKTAEFIAQYFKKGSGIELAGSIQTRSYDDKNGNKRYITEVVVDEAGFPPAKKEEENIANKYSDLEEVALPKKPAAPKSDEQAVKNLLGEEFKPAQLDDSELPF